MRTEANKAQTEPLWSTERVPDIERIARAIATADGCATDACQRHMMQSYKCLAEAALVAMQDGWQLIETAPKDGTAIDVWFHLSDSHAARWPNVRWNDARERWIGGPTDQGMIHWLATHWMPLPAPPSLPALLVQS